MSILRLKLNLQHGFSLMEVLIAVLVLAIGLLGYASLQLTSVNTNLDAYFQSQATILGNDLGSRILANREYVSWDTRANPQGTTTPPQGNESKVGDRNVYVTPAASLRTGFSCSVAGPSSLTSGGATVPGINCAAQGQADPASPATPNACDEQQLALFDVWEVCRYVEQILPEGRLHVRCQDRPTITIGGQINPMPNPFPSNHLYFENIPEPLTGNDADACSPGSLYTIYVSWRRPTVRNDSGEIDQIGANANYRCTADLGFSAATNDDNRDCVAIDLLP